MDQDRVLLEVLGKMNSLTLSYCSLDMKFHSRYFKASHHIQIQN